MTTVLGGLFLLDVLGLAWGAYALELSEACRLWGWDARVAWLGWAGLALALVGRKRSLMWGSEAYAVEWTLGQPQAPSPAVRGLRILAQAAYVLVLALALVGLLLGAQSFVGWGAFLVVGTLMLTHAVAEVQPRYHYYAVPLFCALAGLALSALRRPTAGA